jgi:cytidyltransferase-like protein
MIDNIVLVTGGFDPIHSGHIAHIKAARKLGRVIVGINSNEWLARKKGAAFMPIEDRLDIIKNLKDVMHTFTFNDSDGSAKDAITKVRELFPNNKIIFANGGDRTSVNIPEMDTTDSNIEFVFGVGGEDKKNSSSWILSEWKAPKTERPWGYYRIIHTDGHHTKVKELTVLPGKSLSMQSHTNRNEYWLVSQGIATVNLNKFTKNLLKHENCIIRKGEWHQLSNQGTEDLKIIEIQYGDNCDENDITRL